MTELPYLTGLPALAQPGCRILILGSMPSQQSLAEHQYYAHPRNQFWPLMQQIFGLSASGGYPERCQALMTAGIALWDVIGQCQRPGSLDSAIVKHSVRFNDLAGFYLQYPTLQQIWLNGGKALQCYRQYQGSLPVEQARLLDALPCRPLPSSSPAHASLSFADKLALWQPS